MRDGPGLSRLRKGPLQEGNHLGAALAAWPGMGANGGFMSLAALKAEGVPPTW